MKIVVCVKQVAILGDEVEFTSDERDVDEDYLEFALNEWDSYSLEAALLIKEAVGEGEVVAVTVGNEDAEEALRRCLAMGADRAVRVAAEAAHAADPLTIARGLAAAIGPEDPDLIFAGVQSSDSVQASRRSTTTTALDARRSTASSRGVCSTSSTCRPQRSSPSRPGSTNLATRHCAR